MTDTDEHEGCRNVGQEIVTALIPACSELLAMVANPKLPGPVLLRCIANILAAVRKAREL